MLRCEIICPEYERGAGAIERATAARKRRSSLRGKLFLSVLYFLFSFLGQLQMSF